MKSLKKRVCVSVFLDELFEAVDEEGKGHACNELEKVREADTRIVRSQLIAEEILFGREARPRKYRNALRISQRGHVYFRDQLRRLESEEDWRPPAVEKVDRETSTSLKSDDENDFDVDEYSLSDLNLDLYAEDEDSKAQRVDVALSTCFTEALPYPGHGGQHLPEQAGKLHESTQTDAENLECERARFRGEKIVEDISRDNKCFLVGRCAKSTNLAAWNHKSTQLGLATSPIPEEVSPARGVDAGGSELRQVFHYMNSRKHSVNTLTRASKALTRRSGRTPPRVPDAKDDVIGDFVQREEKWGCAVEETEAKVIKKGFCDVTVRTFVKTNTEHIICYTLSVPWELTNLGEVIIPENDLRYRHSINESLTLFMTGPRDVSQLSPVLMGTQCTHEIGKCWGCSSGAGGQRSAAVIEELPCEDKPEQAEQTGGEVKATPETEEQGRDETSTLDRQKVVESLASEITEQIKLLDKKKQERLVADKSVITEPQARGEEDDVSVQWELEIEIQNEETSEVRDTARTENSNTQMIKAIEGSSRTNVVLMCQSPFENSLVIEDCSQHSRLSEIEQCYLKDEKIRKMYLANVPRRLLRVTEQRLKEIGRS